MLAILVFSLFSPPAGYEDHLLDELRAENPTAVELFERANQEREAEQGQAAADLYAQVAALAPHFDPALRRECGTRSQLGDHARAIALCRAALRLKVSPEKRNTSGKDK